MTRIGLLGSVGLILFVFEGLAPRPLPWMKLGLGNLAVLLGLLVYGFSAGLIISLLKLSIGGLLSGSLGGPAFVIGGGAGLASLLAMGAVRKGTGRLFSPIGLSIIGALVHQTSQLLLAYIYVGQAGIFSLLPLFLATGLVSGALIGLLVYWCLEKLQAAGWLDE